MHPRLFPETITAPLIRWFFSVPYVHTSLLVIFIFTTIQSPRLVCLVSFQRIRTLRVFLFSRRYVEPSFSLALLLIDFSLSTLCLFHWHIH